MLIIKKINYFKLNLQCKLLSDINFFKNKYFLFCKLLVVNLIIFSMCTQCSILDNLIYNQNIYQGNYFTEKDINKIKNGMTQEQIVYILGYPMLTDPFGTETWFYIFRQNLSINLIKQKSLILYFNKKGILINFKKIE